ncbi:MAG: hypothetical protein PGN25_12375 [Methylorubrum populi]
MVGILGLALVAGAAGRFLDARTVAASARASRYEALVDEAVLSSLQAIRFERSNSFSSLVAGSSQARETVQKLVATRAEVDKNLAEVAQRASALDDAPIATLVSAAQREHRALVGLRPQLDDAFTKEVEAREPALAERWTIHG